MYGRIARNGIIWAVSVFVLAFKASLICCDGEGVNGDKVQVDTIEENDQVTQQWMRLGDHATPVDNVLTELDYTIGGADFYAHFIRKREPVIFRGIASNWNATKNWHNESYLQSTFGHVLMDVELGKIYRNELHPRKTMNMTEFLGLYKNKSVYLDSPFPQTEMMNDLEVPYFMECPELSSNFTSAHLLFSSGNTSSCFHQDSYENLLTMISGIKVVTLVNYTYAKEVYADHIDTFPGLSPISPEGVDFDKWPLFRDVPFFKVTLYPGDLVYIPKGWWHHVRSFGCPNIGVAIWFHVFANETEPDDNEEVLGIRDVVKLEKAFAKLVASAPERIQCKSQNMPITDFLQFEQTWNLPDDENFAEKIVKLSTGYEIPLIGFGTAGLFEKTEEMVKVALEQGYRMIDSAQAYNESAVGYALKSSGIDRSSVFIVSKVHPKNLGFDTTIESVHESLANFQTDYIDLMLIHSKDCDEGPDAHLACGEGEPKGNWTETWKALEFMADKGKIRSIGVSNFEIEDLQTLQNIKKKEIAVVQNWFDPFYTDDHVRKWCKENGVAYMGHSTLGDSWVREGLGYNPVMQNKDLKRISRWFDADIARVVLRWAIGNDVIVIPRSSNPQHIATNLMLGVVKLEPADIEYFALLKNTLNPNTIGQSQDKTSSAKIGTETQSEDGFVYSNICHEDVSLDRPNLFLSSDDYWIYSFDAESGKVKWKTETGDETGSSCDFSSSEETIYCGADDSYIRALYTRNGTLAWKYKTGASVTSSCHVTKDGTIVVGSHDNNLYAVYPNGTLRWKFEARDAIWSSPISNKNGDLVFITSFAEFGSNIHVIDLKTGKQRWESSEDGGFISSPALSPDESSVIFCSGYGNVVALDLWTGEVLWKRLFQGTIESTPVFSKNNKLFIATHEGEVAAIDSRKGKLLWNKHVSVNLTSSPTLGPDGQIFIGGGDGEIIALKQKDGGEIWRKKIGSSIFFSSARLSTNGMLYIGTADKKGKVYALDYQNGDIIWNTETNGPIVGTPLITKKYSAKYY